MAKDNFKKFVKEMNELIHSDTFIETLKGRDQEKLLCDLFKYEDSFKKKLLKIK